MVPHHRRGNMGEASEGKGRRASQDQASVPAKRQQDFLSNLLADDQNGGWLKYSDLSMGFGSYEPGPAASASRGRWLSVAQKILSAGRPGSLGTVRKRPFFLLSLDASSSRKLLTPPALSSAPFHCRRQRYGAKPRWGRLLARADTAPGSGSNASAPAAPRLLRRPAGAGGLHTSRARWPQPAGSGLSPERSS